jgi:hypothetical protein
MDWRERYRPTHRSPADELIVTPQAVDADGATVQQEFTILQFSITWPGRILGRERVGVPLTSIIWVIPPIQRKLTCDLLHLRDARPGALLSLKSRQLGDTV